MMLYLEEETIEEETKEAWEDLLEDDEISPEEQAFMQGWIEAGTRKKQVELEVED